MYITIIGVFHSHSLSVDSVNCYTLCKKPFVTLQKEDVAAPGHGHDSKVLSNSLEHKSVCLLWLRVIGLCHHSRVGDGGVTVGGWRDAKINPAVAAASAVTCLVSNGPWLNGGKRLGERRRRRVCRD